VCWIKLGVQVLHEPSPTSIVIQESDCPVIVLTSGQTLKIRRVRLYEADKVKEIGTLKASAIKNLGGVSTGIGFWGSPAWALGGAAALGILESIVSNATRKQGLELLKKAETKFHEMAKGALYFESTKLINSNVPYPQAWSAIGTAEQYINVSELNWLARKNLLIQNNKRETDIENINGVPCLVIRKWDTEYIHDGDEFVNVDTTIWIINIRWSQVVAYFPPQRLPAT